MDVVTACISVLCVSMYHVYVPCIRLVPIEAREGIRSPELQVVGNRNMEAGIEPLFSERAATILNY